MPGGFEQEAGAGGTRFLLYPQPSFLKDFEKPETVWVSPSAGTVGPGPSDDRMYVVDPIGKTQPYGVAPEPFGSQALYLPPWTGRVHPPAEPDPSGHFDHIEPGTPEFEAVHLYGSVRRVLDIWEGYFGRPIAWHFGRDFERLELSRLSHVDNAFAGYGFLEAGANVTDDGITRPYSLNFDVIAHEVGHLIVYSEIGVPSLESEAGEYYGFHESAADMVALVSALNFDSVLDDLLETTHGNLYTFNKVNRFAELSENEQIRLASNPFRLKDFSAGWRDEHLLAQPLTGALFDILVDVFHELLVDRGLIDKAVEELSDLIETSPDYHEEIQPLFDDAYELDPDGFRGALRAARDYLGTALAECWGRLSPHYLSYDDVGIALHEADRALSGGAFRRIIRTNFRGRDIGSITVGPRLSEPNSESHLFSARTMVPDAEGSRQPRLSYRERMAIAGRCGISHNRGRGR